MRSRLLARTLAVMLLSAFMMMTGHEATGAHVVPAGSTQRSASRHQPEGQTAVTDAARAAARVLSGSARVERRGRPVLSPWAWPVIGRHVIARLFTPPAQRWLPGHRGVDLATAGDGQVRAVASGQVQFAGQVAGVGVVSVSHGDGLVSTYQPVRASVSRGEVVVRGQWLGRLGAAGSHCQPVTCLHLGARRHGEYVDPAMLLQEWEVSLLPVHGVETMYEVERVPGG